MQKWCGVTWKCHIIMPSKLPSRLVQSRHGIYYLRLIKNGREQRWSLRTRDPAAARLAAYQFGVEIMAGRGFSGWTLKKDGDKIEVSTDGTHDDHLRGLEALKVALAQQATSTQPAQPVTQSSGMTVSDACDAYLLKRQKDVTASTLRTWRTAFERLKTDLGARDVTTITDTDLDTIGNALDEQKRARKTIANYYDAWRLLFDYLKKTGKVSLNPVIKPQWTGTVGKRLDAERARPRQPYSADDLKTLFARDRLSALTRPDELWLPCLALYTGARLEALCRLRTADFSEYSPGCWQLRFDSQHDKTGRERTIPLHPGADRRWAGAICS
jgi:hypothetical protein